MRDTRTILALALLPMLFWTGGPESAAALRRAGISRFFAPPAQVSAWKQAGFDATALGEDAFGKRTLLTVPGIDRKVTVASATTAPWVNASGWEFRRAPKGEFRYDLTSGAGPGAASLAAAEAFAYGANAVVKIDPAELDGFAKMMDFLGSIPERSLPDVADFGFIDDGSDSAGELLNLLSRRNLLYRIVRAPDPQLRLNVKADSDDPHLFAAKVREHLHDEQRSLRVYGSEVVLCRMVADKSTARIHLLNYGRRALEGIRVRVRGDWAHGKLYAPVAGELRDYAVADGFTEFSLPELGPYAVVELVR